MQPEAELVLNLFLKFGIFEARCSYKIVLIYKKACKITKISIVSCQVEKYGDSIHYLNQKSLPNKGTKQIYAVNLVLLLAFFSVKASIKLSRSSALASSFSIDIIDNSSNRSCRIAALK